VIRWLVLVLLAPLWLPLRLLGWARWRWHRCPTLHVRLAGALPDLPRQHGLLGLLRRPEGLALFSLLEALEAALGDPVIVNVVVQLEPLQCGLGRAEEVRAALARLRAAGKRVIVHADELGLQGYWIALGASSVRLSPTGSLDVSGVAMEFTLLRDVLARAGVHAQLLAKGAYKSMREVFTESKMSDANREMLTSLVGDLASQLVQQVAAARGQTLEVARAHLDHGPFRADEARERSLIDSTQYWDELWDEIGGETRGAYRLARYRKLVLRRHLWPQRQRVVALVGITGNIRSGNDRQGPIGSVATGHHSVRRALAHVRKSKRVVALVVRVDSPGGSALASDLMWRDLTLTASVKPTFVSMVNVAASGGYYASGLKGASVWANPTTLTGSIGVVGGKFEVSNLLSKLGVVRETVASGPRAGFHSISTPWNEQDLAKLDADLEALYRDFVTKMADARGVSFEALHAVAQGRVWTGQQAREIALVDHLGGVHDVKLALRERLGLRPEVGLRWSAPREPKGFRARRAAEADELARLAAPLSRLVPELGEALGLALDVGGERLLCLSPIQLRSPQG